MKSSIFVIWILALCALGILIITHQDGHIQSDRAPQVPQPILSNVVSTNPNFTLTVSPSNVQAFVGYASSSRIVVNGTKGFAGSVSLTVDNTDCKATPDTVSANQTSTLTCTFTSAITVDVNVTGTNNAHSQTVAVTFQVQDFSINIDPSSVTENVGNSISSTIRMNGLNGFTGKVSLTLKSDPSLGCNLDQTIVSNSQSVSLTCKPTVSGQFIANITGSAAPLVHSVVSSYIVQDFTLKASAPIPVNYGTTATSAISADPSSTGFDGSVTLSANEPTGSVICAFSKNPVSVPALIVMSCNSKNPGSFIVTITGSSSPIVHETNVTMTFGDFSMTANPSLIPIHSGSVTTSTIIVTSAGYSGQINLQVGIISPPGFSANLNPANLVLVAGGSNSSILTISTGQITPVGSYSLAITCANCNSGPHTLTVNIDVVGNLTVSSSDSHIILVPGSSSTSNIGVTSIGVTGILNVAYSTSTPLLTVGLEPTGNISPGMTVSVPLSITALPTLLAGNYTVTVTASASGVIGSMNFTVTVQDFAMTVNPNPVSVVAGASGTTVLTVEGIQGFNGTVFLTVTPIPSGPTVSITPTSVALTNSNEMQNATLTLQVSMSIQPRIYIFKLIGTSGTLQHQILLELSVVEFAVIAPSSINLVVGQNSSSMITVSSRNGFSGNVILVANGPANSGITVSITPITFFLPQNTTNTCVLTVTANKPGIFILTVNGTSGHGTSYQYVFLYVGDFAISNMPSSTTVAPAGSKTFSVTISSEYDFVGTVSLTTTSSADGPSVSFNPVSAVLSAKGSVGIQFTISGGHSVPGIYNVKIFETSGQLSHSHTVTVTIALPPFLTVPDNESIYPGSLLNFYVNATDQDPNVRLIATSTLPGASFITSYRTSLGETSVIGLFSWKPLTSQASGDYVVAFTAQDHNGGTVTKQVIIHVNSNVTRSISLPSSLIFEYGLIAVAGIIATIAGAKAWRNKKTREP